MKSTNEFVIGKHGIGYVTDFFKENFKDIEFSERPTPKFQKLPRRMKDEEIESELKPGICELGDIIAFMDNAPEECKDGNWNLFYTGAFVVGVYWFGGGWRVDAWRRGDNEWDDGSRVFSPATEISRSIPCPHCSLELRIFELEEWKKKVEKILNV